MALLNPIRRKLIIGTGLVVIGYLLLSGVFSRSEKVAISTEPEIKHAKSTGDVVSDVVSADTHEKDLSDTELTSVMDQIAKLSEEINSLPKDAELYYRRALLYSKAKYPLRAIEGYKKTLELKPTHFNSLFNLAIIEAGLGNNDSSIEYFTKSINIAPTDPVVYYNRALIYLKNKKYDLASDDLDKALSLSANYIEALYSKGVLLLQKDQIADALINLEKAFALSKQSENTISQKMLADLNYQLSIANFNVTNLNKALDFANNAIKVDSLNHKYYYIRYLIYDKMGSMDKANADLDKSKTLELDTMLNKK